MGTARPVSPVPRLPVYDVGRVGSVTELLYRLHLAEFEEHLSGLEPGTIWVSALTQCPRKWLYMQRFPEVARAQFKGAFALGRAAHLGLQQILALYAGSLGFSRLEVEREVVKRINVERGDLPAIVTLRGRVDALAVDGAGERVVIEIKTARSDAGLPHEHHVEQLRIYMNMAGARRGILLYLTPDRVAEYTYTEPVDDEELQRLIEGFLRFEGPRYEWECRYCPYAPLCPFKRGNHGR